MHPAWAPSQTTLPEKRVRDADLCLDSVREHGEQVSGASLISALTAKRTATPLVAKDIARLTVRYDFQPDVHAIENLSAKRQGRVVCAHNLFIHLVSNVS